MEFGIFDHLDADGQALGQTYETRLKVVEAYDRLGFRSYHVAEHHFTPLGMAASPSVFLSAVAQRSKRLRFGPLIYALPFSHPIRLAEEIAMLDHMSGGRLEMGFGRGASLIELDYIGHSDASSQAVFKEGLEVVLKTLISDRLNFHGEHFHFEDVPIHLRPLQRPHPPLWYGLHSLPSAERVARQGWNVVTNERPSTSGAVLARFRETWRQDRGPETPFPMMGLARHIVVADTDEAALDIARRAYKVWLASFAWLFDLHGTLPTHWKRSVTFDILRDEEERGVAGSPATVIEWLSRHIEATGANYLVGQHQFGDMTLPETLRSLELYAGKVMPELRRRFG
jgi:alkanesulfonate monooxygenase SsuD/methylene tetrahydromethanopterin reductase-like flavin-dependent oxidoreductase (luciferase family)